MCVNGLIGSRMGFEEIGAAGNVHNGGRGWMGICVEIGRNRLDARRNLNAAGQSKSCLSVCLSVISTRMSIN